MGADDYDRRAFAQFGCSLCIRGWAKIWVNGTLVRHHLVSRLAVARQDCFNAHLRKGANTVPAKVGDGVGGRLLWRCRATEAVRF